MSSAKKFKKRIGEKSRRMQQPSQVSFFSLRLQHSFSWKLPITSLYTKIGIKIFSKSTRGNTNCSIGERTKAAMRCSLKTEIPCSSEATLAKTEKNSPKPIKYTSSTRHTKQLCYQDIPPFASPLPMATLYSSAQKHKRARHAFLFCSTFLGHPRWQFPLWRFAWSSVKYALHANIYPRTKRRTRKIKKHNRNPPPRRLARRFLSSACRESSTGTRKKGVLRVSSWTRRLPPRVSSWAKVA